jgi:hypothetical protein
MIKKTSLTTYTLVTNMWTTGVITTAWPKEYSWQEKGQFNDKLLLLEMSKQERTHKSTSIARSRIRRRALMLNSRRLSKKLILKALVIAQSAPWPCLMRQSLSQLCNFHAISRMFSMKRAMIT